MIGDKLVVICFQISIFEPLNTAKTCVIWSRLSLWFAFKLVSLNHWIQLTNGSFTIDAVVICFQISIFEPLNTAHYEIHVQERRLWFAFKLVSLNHWIQLHSVYKPRKCVVICFQISIFEPLNTANNPNYELL